MQRDIDFHRFSIFILLTIAVFLRLYNLNTYSLWFDEVGSAIFTFSNIEVLSHYYHLSPGGFLFSEFQNDPHSSLYFLLVYVTSLLWGELFSIRFISAVCGVAASVTLYFTCRFLFGKKAALYSLLLAAINPFYIWYAQEARMYSLALLAATIYLFSVLKAISSNKNSDWFYCFLSALFAAYTSYFCIFLMLSVGAVLIDQRHRTQLLNWIVIHVLVMIAFLPQLLLFREQWNYVSQSFWLLPPDLPQVFYTMGVFFLGYSATLIQYRIFVVLIAAICFWALLKMKKNHPFSLKIFISLTVIPIGLVLLVSLFFVPIYINRQLIVFTPAFLLLLSYGLTQLKDERIARAFIVLYVFVCGLSLMKYYNGEIIGNGNFSHKIGSVHAKLQYQKAFDVMLEEFEKSDLIIATDVHSYDLTRYQIIGDKEESLRDGMFKRFVFAFYPDMINKYEARYQRLEPQLSRLSESDKLFFMVHDELPHRKIMRSWEYDQTHSRLWLLSAGWHKKAPDYEHTDKLHNEVLSKYRLMKVLEADGIVIELYEKRPEDSPFSVKL